MAAMFQQRNIITAVDIGTIKTCVLIGEADDDGDMVILGHGEAPTNGAVSKGEIVDMNAALEALTTALDEADESADCEIDRNHIYMAVTASGIQSYQGVGTVLIRNDNGKVADSDIDEAVQNARVKPLPPDKVILNTFDSYFLLDGLRKLRNPIDQAASKLEAFIHVIYGEGNRIKNYENALRDVGFEEEDGIPVFSGVAAAYGVLEENEKENGVLLVEIGGGSTEYVAVHNYGIVASGVIGVGMEHVANDLAIGFDMHISSCRKFFQENKYLRHKQDGRAFLEVSTATGAPRRLPINSIENIVNLRLSEIFKIINDRLKKENLMHSLSCGGILSGGAALYPQAHDAFSNVMEIPVRVGKPLGVSGAVTDIESPRYSVPWGLLKYGYEMRKVMESRGGNSLWEKMMSGMDNMSMPIFRGFSSLKNSIKF